MNAPGTIAFCTVASVIIFIAAIQCYRIWQQDKRLKKQRMNDDLGNSDQNPSTAVDLENGVEAGGGGALSEQANAPSRDQPVRALELSLPSVCDGSSGKRPGSVYEGLEVVPPDMVKRRDFAVAAAGHQTQRWPEGENWTEYANSFASIQQDRSTVPEQPRHQEPAHHQNPGLLQASPLPSRSPSPVSRAYSPAQVHVGRSMQHQVQRTEASVSVHSAHSSVQIASPPPLFYRPWDQQAGQEMHLQALSKSLDAIGSVSNAEEGNPTIQELESPLQPASSCLTLPQPESQQPRHPFSETQGHTRQVSNESQTQSTYQARAQPGGILPFRYPPTAPMHSHSSSFPTTGKQLIKEPSLTDDHQQHSQRSTPGRFSLSALTSLPTGKRWSWKPQDDAAFSRNGRAGDA